MELFIDGDGCPVIAQCLAAAKTHGVLVTVFSDTSHMPKEEHCRWVTVSKGSDAVDFALLNHLQPGDLCVTQDYGLAAMVLGKGGYAMHPNGFFYTAENIDRLLFERHIKKELRRQKTPVKGHQKKRTEAQNQAFFTALLAFFSTHWNP